ncbi:DUF4906 domain-containing protein, partial [uncultured Rikenella sp.]|uniref:DUF4906 domain-containing protein n=1 Tax=uncultured Rikenella sp. TaxID=368003 RepID=UPI002612FD09
MKKLIALCSATLLLASCTKRINEGFGGTGDPVQVELGFTIEAAASAVEGGGKTKTYESEAMEVVFSEAEPALESKASIELTNVWAVQFDAAGEFVTASKTASLAVGTPLKPILKAGKSQRIYVVAAMSDNTDFSTALAGKTVADFKKMAATLGAAPNMGTSAGIPLCSDEVTADIYSNGKFLSKTGIKLKRVVAQILFTAQIGSSAAENYTITSVKLVNKPKNAYFAIPDGATYPVPAAGNFEEAAADKGVKDQQTWFVPDNVRGTISNSDPLKKVPNAVLGDYCTYVEVKAERVAVGEKKLATMKIYLGSNMTDNFNIERNKIYTITCTINDFEVAGDNRVNITTMEAPVANCYMLVPGSAAVTYIPVKRANEIYTAEVATLYGLADGTTYQGGTDAQEGYNGPTGAPWVVESMVYRQADSLPEYADKRVWIAEIAWQDEANGGQPLVVIENPVITNRRDLIRVRANGGGAGNCIIRLRRAKKADGSAWDNETVWSWHLWVTSYQPGDASSSREPGAVPGSAANGAANDGTAAVHTYAGWLNNDPGTEAISGGVKHPIMDRNLGAMSASPGVASYGLLYQWGRKDPFVGSRDGSNENGKTFYVPTYSGGDTESRSISDWTAYNTVDGTAAGNTGKGDLGVRKVNAADLGNTIFSAIRNPVAFYFAAAQNDWTSPQNGELWR